MSKLVSQKYLDALKSIDGWATVSEWAARVGEVFPEILEMANQEAAGQKNETTGLREIAARISSNISRGAYIGFIEIDESERPRRVKALSESDSKNYEQKEIDDDLAPITRAQKIKTDTESLSVKDLYRLTKMAVSIQKIVSKKMNIELEEDVIEQIISRLRLIY